MRQSQILKYLLVVGISPIVHLLHRIAVKLVCRCWRNQDCGETHRGERTGTYTLGTRESATRRGRAFFFITRLRGLSRAVTRRSRSGFLWPTGFVVVNGGGVMPAPLCLFFNELEDGIVSARTYMIKKRTENSEKFIVLGCRRHRQFQATVTGKASTGKPGPCGVVLTARHTPIPPPAQSPFRS